jgi:hypothetical protein
VLEAAYGTFNDAIANRTRLGTWTFKSMRGMNTSDAWLDF